jgi:hypothetical protein
MASANFWIVHHSSAPGTQAQRLATQLPFHSQCSGKNTTNKEGRGSKYMEN